MNGTFWRTNVSFFRVLFCVLLPAALFLFAFTVQATINQEIAFYGTLKNSTGDNLDGTYDMVFRFYDASSGGTLLETSTHTTANGNAITVSDGEFVVQLGSGTGNALTGIDFNSASIYVGLTVEGDSEMTPRRKLSAAPYAFNSDTLDGIDSASFVRNDTINTVSANSASALLSLTQSGLGDILNIFDSAVEVFTIVDGGNVGIGTTSPSQKLSLAGNFNLTGGIYMNSTELISDVGGGYYDILGGVIQMGDVGDFYMNDDLTVYGDDIYFGGGGSIGSPSVNKLALYTSGLERLTVAVGGNIGVGTTSPYAKLAISGNMALTGGLYDNTASLGTNGMILQTTGGGVRWVATSTLGFSGGGSSLFTDGGSGTSYLTTLADSLAVGTTSTNAKLSVYRKDTSAAPLSTTASLITYIDTGVITSGTDSISGSTITVTRSGSNGGNTYASGQEIYLNGTVTSGTIVNTGLYLDVTSSGTGNSTNYGLYTSVSGADNNYSAILMGGNVGIGTTTPTEKLSVYGANGAQAGIHSGAAGTAGLILDGFRQNDNSAISQIIAYNINDDIAQIAIYREANDDAANIRFYTQPNGGGVTERMRLTSLGSLGLGTTTPSAQLHTTGSVRFQNFAAGGLSTDANGNVTASSDERLKNILSNYTEGIDAILGIDPIIYKWNEKSGLETEHEYLGFSAQNVQDFIPQAIDEDSRGFLTLSDRGILAAVVNSLKEIWEKLSRQDSRINSLEARIAELEEELNVQSSYTEPPLVQESELQDEQPIEELNTNEAEVKNLTEQESIPNSNQIEELGEDSDTSAI